jgi:hypothetical protein
MMEQRKFGDFADTHKIIEAVTREFKNITVIKGFDFVPQDENLFADARLHPNDKGLELFFGSLANKILNA